MKPFATLAALVAAPMLAGAAPAADPSAAACALAREIVTEAVLRHPLPKTQVVSDTARDDMNLTETAFTPWRGKAAPPLPLVRAYLANKQTVLACDGVRKLLDEAGVQYGAEPVARARAFFRTRFAANDAPVAVHSISLPVMSADGRQALVFVGTQCKGLCGFWSARYYRRGPAGRWTSDNVGVLRMS